MQNFNQFDTSEELSPVDEVVEETPAIKWYKTKPGVIFLVILSIIFLVVILFSAFVAYYAIKIKLGLGSELEQKFNPKTNTSEVVRVDLSKYLRTDNPVIGKNEAPITIVMYYDLMCPICAKGNPVFRAMMEKYSEIVKVVYKNFPIESAHSGTIELAEKALCAHEQGKFVEFTDAVYSGQKFDAESVNLIAQNLKLDTKKFKLCVDETRYRDTVEKDMAELSNLKLRGTPTFFVNGMRVEGEGTVESWDKIIINELTRLNSAQK